MNKILLLSVGFILFGCEKTSRTSETETTKTTTTEITPQSVEKGAGTEISPQLEGIEDSAVRLKVDTASISEETPKAK